MADACADIRALSSEVALGVAPAEERARVLGHVASCADCRAFLVELSAVVDDLMALTPEAEPPGGFESAVLERLNEDSAAHTSGRRRAHWPVLVAAVVAMLLAGLAAGAVHVAGRDDRELAAAARRTLAVAGGKYFAAFPLVAGDGRQQGVVFGYQGDPAWVVVTFDEPPAGGPYAVELVGLDGTVHRLAGELDPAAAIWSADLPIAIHEASELRIVDRAGHAILAAELLPP
jgi:Putative zinc-finger